MNLVHENPKTNPVLSKPDLQTSWTKRFERIAGISENFEEPLTPGIQRIADVSAIFEELFTTGGLFVWGHDAGRKKLVCWGVCGY
jgi:hypothetical protein